MGIGNSKLNGAEGESVSIPAKIRPMLTGKFEEFKKRRNVTQSKKQLLNDFAEEDPNSSQSSHRETTTTTTKTQDKKVSYPNEIQPPIQEIGVSRAITITTEKLSRVVPMPNSTCEIEDNNPNMEQVQNDKDFNQGKVIHAAEIAEVEVKTEDGKFAEQRLENEQKICVEETPKPGNKQKGGVENHKGSNDDDNDKDDDEDGSEVVNRFLCPGSPSFRIYCIEAEEMNGEECNKPPTIVMHHKSHSAAESTTSRNSNEVVQVGQIEPIKRRGSKKKFGTMKTLLRVLKKSHRWKVPSIGFMNKLHLDSNNKHLSGGLSPDAFHQNIFS
ncbi:hypothetical protein RJT34_03013 [Clitoria ternatea]|uniref:Uncharacterized protein n=1 Tax=Clitoria ternatea TaxID=43366 RepID=A0AAN9KJH7_CLITE